MVFRQGNIAKREKKFLIEPKDTASAKAAIAIVFFIVELFNVYKIFMFKFTNKLYADFLKKI